MRLSVPKYEQPGRGALTRLTPCRWQTSQSSSQSSPAGVRDPLPISGVTAPWWPLSLNRESRRAPLYGGLVSCGPCDVILSPRTSILMLHLNGLLEAKGKINTKRTLAGYSPLLYHPLQHRSSPPSPPSLFSSLSQPPFSLDQLPPFAAVLQPAVRGSGAPPPLQAYAQQPRPLLFRTGAEGAEKIACVV